MTTGRAVLGGLGVLLGLYGAWLLLSRGHDLVDVAIWLAAGVVLHDGVLAVLTIALGALAVRLVPPVLRAPLVVAFVVLGSVTLLAVPVLGRFGSRPDNPTLLDRDYTAGWLVLAGLTALAVVLAVVVAVVVTALVRSRHRHGHDRAGG